MLESVKIKRRQSEIRSALSELVGKDKPTEDETRSMETLDAEYRQNEVRYRAALIAEDTERRDAGEELATRGDREYADLLRRFEVRPVALHYDEGRQLGGPTPDTTRVAKGKRGTVHVGHRSARIIKKKK